MNEFVLRMITRYEDKADKAMFAAAGALVHYGYGIRALAIDKRIVIILYSTSGMSFTRQEHVNYAIGAREAASEITDIHSAVFTDNGVGVSV